MDTKVKRAKRIPIIDAKSIGIKHGYSQVIITAWDRETGITSVVTWGDTLKDAEESAIAGNSLKKALGWDESLCNTIPARVKRKQLKNNLNNV